MYNVIFSSVPIIVVGLLEQDCEAYLAIRFPILYHAGPQQEYFNLPKFVKDMVKGIFHACVAFFFLVAAMSKGGQVNRYAKDDADYASFSLMLSFTIVFLVNLELAIEIRNWTWLHLASIAIGPLMWVVIFGFKTEWHDWLGITFVYNFHGAFIRVLVDPMFWAAFALIVIVALLPSVYGMLLRQHFYPNPLDAVCRAKLGGHLEAVASDSWAAVVNHNFEHHETQM